MPVLEDALVNLTFIQTFFAIVEMGNFNKAASHLHVTQSTVSMRIDALERSLGQRLFTRTKAATRLTAAGRALLPYAETMVRTWRKARQELALPKGFVGVFNLGGVDSLWTGYLVEWLAHLRATMSQAAIQGYAGDRDKIAQLLNVGVVDVAILYDPMVRSGLDAVKLFGETLVLVSTEKRRLVRWDPKYVYVDWGGAFRDSHNRAYPVDETPVATFDSAERALDYLRVSGGSAYLPKRWMDSRVHATRLFPVPKAPMFELGVYAVFDRSLIENDWRAKVVDSLLAYNGRSDSGA
jgi:DNA-binding transcriptional LysR family regulator